MVCNFGVVGLGVMGANLARNIESRGYRVAGYDLDPRKVKVFADAVGGDMAVGVTSPEALMAAIERPRRILMMVPAGAAVDEVIAHLVPYVEAGDILIDGGNSFFRDTDRRAMALEEKGILFVGAGVSGGEEGALRGPAIMTGGARAAWETIAPVLDAIAAKATDGLPCVGYMGRGGAGHYVKMVHNGIEYGEMQLLAETYDLFSRGLGMSAADVAAIFADWNDGDLQSYLVEISVKVLAFVDTDTDRPLVDLILDEAQQKGTGKWMSQNAFDVGAPIPTVNAALEARLVSAQKNDRLAASQVLAGPTVRFTGDRVAVVSAARDALYASRVAAYAQGLALLRLASVEYDYGIDIAEVARIWRAGCIIRAALLEDVRRAFSKNPALMNLLVDDVFAAAVGRRQAGWRRMVTTAVELGIPVPATSASLAYYDAYRSARLPANLTQGQRDFFGAHTYRRTDRDGVFHTDWTSLS